MKYAAVLVTGWFLLASADVSAQSLGDVARKEAERRKTAPDAAKVYTGDTLRPDPSGSRRPAPAQSEAEKPAPAAASGSGTSESESASSETPPKDEKYWRDRIQAERDALQRAQMFAEALESRVNALSTDFASRDDPAQRSELSSNRQKALAEMERVKQEIQQHTKNIATIQEEGRRAGVPAGWVR